MVETATINANHLTIEAPTTTWQVDPSRSRVEFTIGGRLLLVRQSTVRGRFSDVAGTARLDERTPTDSRAELVVGAASLETGNGRRDRRLKSADFFDVARYPRLTFASRAVEAVDDDAGHYRVTGALTIRDVRREVTLDLHYTPPRGRARLQIAYFTGTTVLNRRDFGLSWNSRTIKVEDEARVTLALELLPARAG
jgi:polyisoprenoid-binding protein YceI